MKLLNTIQQETVSPLSAVLARCSAARRMQYLGYIDPAHAGDLPPG